MSENIENVNSKLNLWQKLALITGEVGVIEKTGSNNHFGYKFIEQRVVVATLAPILEKYGIVIIPKSSSVVSVAGDKSTISIAWQIINVDNPTETYDVLSWVSEAADKQDKGINKAQTANEKTLLMKLFHISDYDADQDSGITTDNKSQAKNNNQAKSNSKATAQARPAPAQSSPLATAEQLETIRNMASDKGVTGDKLEARCKDIFKVSLNKLTNAQAVNMLQKLTELATPTPAVATAAPQLNFQPATGDDAAAARALVINGGYDHKLKYDQFTSWFKELTPKGIPADKFGAEVAGIFGAKSVKDLLDAMGKAELQDRFRLVLLEYVFYKNANPGKTKFGFNWDLEHGIPVDVTELAFNQVFDNPKEVGAA